MRRFLGTSIGKTVGQLARLRGSGGQALPGLVVERLLPGYSANMLAQLPDGVVVITGTNGKTTTTKMVVELLERSGKRVLTNPTGSNFTRGIISSVSQQASLSGKLPFDIGVFELDEAYARHFVAQVKPRWVLALNVMRDQLDRFGELDTAAQLIGTTMQEATDGVVVNGDDARLVRLSEQIRIQNGHEVRYFGVAPALRQFFPADDEIVAVANGKTKVFQENIRAVELADFTNGQITFAADGQRFTSALRINGQHNYQNAAAALTLVRALIPDAPWEQLINSLSAIEPAFGRGERFELRNGSTLQLLLVKNPAGFRQTLASYGVADSPVMIAINDDYADSRDVSWLWDVDFSTLAGTKIQRTTGRRAADMALRLRYDDVEVEQVVPDLDTALQQFCAEPGSKLLITTYTAMLHFYKRLKKEAGKAL